MTRISQQVRTVCLCKRCTQLKQVCNSVVVLFWRKRCPARHSRFSLCPQHFDAKRRAAPQLKSSSFSFRKQLHGNVKCLFHHGAPLPQLNEQLISRGRARAHIRR